MGTIIDFNRVLRTRKTKPATTKLSLLEEYIGDMRKKHNLSAEAINDLTIDAAIEMRFFVEWHRKRFNCNPPAGRFLRKNYSGD